MYISLLHKLMAFICGAMSLRDLYPCTRNLVQGPTMVLLGFKGTCACFEVLHFSEPTLPEVTETRGHSLGCVLCTECRVTCTCTLVHVSHTNKVLASYPGPPMQKSLGMRLIRYLLSSGEPVSPAWSGVPSTNTTHSLFEESARPPPPLFEAGTKNL